MFIKKWMKSLCSGDITLPDDTETTAAKESPPTKPRFTRESLKRLANRGNPPSDKTVLESEWWRIFQRRLSGMKLVREVERTLPGPLANLYPTFEIVDPEEKISEEEKFFQSNSHESKSWVIDRLVARLGDPDKLSEFNGMAVEKNNLVITALEKDFYGRFAVEMADWVAELSKKNWFEDTVFVRCILGIAQSVKGYAINSQSPNSGPKIEFDTRALGSYSIQEEQEALEKLGISPRPLYSIIWEYESWWKKIVAKDHYKRIIEGDLRDDPYSSVSELSRWLYEAGLHLSDIGGNREELIIACSKFLDQKKRCVIETINSESQFS